MAKHVLAGRGGRALAVAVLGLAAAASLPAGAAAQGPFPAVSFVDNRPLAIPAGELSRTPTVPVAVRNLLRSSQKVSVGVVGLVANAADGAAPARLAPGPRRTPTIRPGQTRVVALRVLAPGQEAPAAGATGLIVAAGRSGDVARRELSIAAVPAAADDADRGEGLSPDDVSAVTIGAVNYLPSWLSPVFPTLIAAGIVLLLLGLALRAAGRGRNVLIGGGVLLALVGIVLDQTTDWSGVRAIHSESVPVAAGVASGPVGAVTNGDGQLADLFVADEELEVEGLDHAATYEGGFDLDRGAEGGSADATVEVRDWWPYALATLLLGLLIGARMRRYFTRTRPQELERLQLEALWAQITRSDGALTRRRVPYDGYRIIARAQARMRDLRDRIEDEAAKPEDVGKEIKGFRDYVRDFDLLVDELGHLHSQHVALDRGRRIHVPELPPEAVPALTGANDLFRRDFDGDDPDPAGEQLRQRRAEVARALGLVEAVYEAFSDIVRNRAAAQKAREEEKPGSARHRELGELIDSWTGLRRDALIAPSLEKLQTVRDADLANLARLHSRGRMLAGFVSEGLAPPTQRSLERASEFGVGILPEEFDRLEIDLECTVVGPTGDERTRAGDLEDEFAFEACFSGLEVLPFGSVVFDFGDGSEPVSMTLPLDREDPCVRVRHTFAVGGTHVVRLLNGEQLLDSTTVEVSAIGRSVRDKATFALLDWQMTLIAGLLAAGSGLVALYFADSSWGEPQDYLAALLWGGVTAEGVKLLAAIADRRWFDAG
jgi:hypothetical protein